MVAIGYYITNPLYIDDKIESNTYGILTVISMIVCLITLLVSAAVIFKVRGILKLIPAGCILVLLAVVGLNLLALFGISYATSH